MEHAETRPTFRGRPRLSVELVLVSSITACETARAITGSKLRHLTEVRQQLSRITLWHLHRVDPFFDQKSDCCLRVRKDTGTNQGKHCVRQDR